MSETEIMWLSRGGIFSNDPPSQRISCSTACARKQSVVLIVSACWLYLVISCVSSQSLRAQGGSEEEHEESEDTSMGPMHGHRKATGVLYILPSSGIGSAP